MSTTLLTQKYEEQLYGVLHCYDRLLFSGNLHPSNTQRHDQGFLYEQKVRIFDYPQFAEPLRDAIRANAERLAEANQIEIEFIRKRETFRKKERVQTILQQRGTQPRVWFASLQHGTVSIVPTLA